MQSINPKAQPTISVSSSAMYPPYPCLFIINQVQFITNLSFLKDTILSNNYNNKCCSSSA